MLTEVCRNPCGRKGQKSTILDTTSERICGGPLYTYPQNAFSPPPETAFDRDIQVITQSFCALAEEGEQLGKGEAGALYGMAEANTKDITVNFRYI